VIQRESLGCAGEVQMPVVHSDEVKVVASSEKCPMSEAAREEEAFQKDLC